MFRCPCCATVTKLPLTENHMVLSNKDMTKWTIEKKPMSISGKVAEVTDLLSLMGTLEKLGLALDMKGDNYIECYQCQTYSKFEAWVGAWATPIEFFDADQLCACGGELWYDHVLGTTRYALQCESCGWVKPRAIINGQEGDIL